MRVAELMNDYRTLQLHISQQTSGLSMGDSQQEGYRVLAQSVAAAQQLLAAGFSTTPVQEHGNSAEGQKAQLRQVILDASVRRFQAHKIYLRVASAKRWLVNHNALLRSPKTGARAVRLREVDQVLHNELGNITDQSIYSDLREADARAGLWVDEDPPLAAIMLWINSHR
ncbi:hypothetical protein BGW36DRAFT_399485 [Talaromyces proteolyticus]|uniref:Uncharacterized protein n=1 Tax=Talaromyces proteolyticus TaxID=1131652 RepID=A0AAD4KNS3_9EURO|nr:uncharacterized protein BGW36DRAFT_399485 [Talaromyces proteolyticus]KAH8692661.1 hypothetical protein BGW36DRAFT_399485 [Talaromyces proteolyticus]